MSRVFEKFFSKILHIRLLYISSVPVIVRVETGFNLLGYKFYLDWKLNWKKTRKTLLELGLIFKVEKA
jgi:hypothetical protein